MAGVAGWAMTVLGEARKQLGQEYATAGKVLVQTVERLGILR
jgi:hypothetical protein